MYLGCSDSLITERSEIEAHGPPFNGVDGFGDIYPDTGDTFNNVNKQVANEPAATAMYRLSQQVSFLNDSRFF